MKRMNYQNCISQMCSHIFDICIPRVDFLCSAVMSMPKFTHLYASTFKTPVAVWNNERRLSKWGDLILIRLKSNNILHISGMFLWASSRLFLDDTSLGYSNQDDKRNIQGWRSNWEMSCSLHLKSTCDVNLLSKLSIIFKEWSYCSLCTLDTIYRLFFCYKINN
jgi:hypothetical protein